MKWLLILTTLASLYARVIRSAAAALLAQLYAASLPVWLDPPPVCRLDRARRRQFYLLQGRFRGIRSPERAYA
jgi:hypothetical protein